MDDKDFDNPSENQNDVNKSVNRLIDSLNENTEVLKDTSVLNDISEAKLTKSLKDTNVAIYDLSEVLKTNLNQQKKHTTKKNDSTPQKKTDSSEEKLNSINNVLSQMSKIMAEELSLRHKMDDREIRSKEKGSGKSNLFKTTKPITMNAKGGQAGGLFGSGLSSLLTLGGLLPKITGVMKKIITLPLKVVANAGKMGLKLVVPLASKIFAPVKSLIGKVFPVVSKIFAPVESLIGKLLPFVNKIFAPVKSLVGKMSSLVSKIFSPIKSLIGKMGGDLLSKVFSKIPALIEKMLPKILSGFNIVGDIAMALSLVWKYIRGYLLDVTKNSPVLNKIVKVLDGIIMPISDFFEHLSDVILNLFKKNTKGVFDSFKNMGTDLINLVKGMFSPILDGFNSISSSIADFVKNNSVIQDIKNGLDKVFTPIQSVINWLSDKASKLAKMLGLDKISSVASDKLKTLPANIAKAANKTANTISDYTTDYVIRPISQYTDEVFQSKEAKANEARVLKAGQEAGLKGKALANFMAQASVESRNFAANQENLNYKTPSLVRKNFGKRAGTDEEIQTLLGNPEKLANKVYAKTGGYKYRGRGPIQLTGIDNYREYGKLLNLDLVNNPDLVLNPDIGAKVSAAYYIKSHAAERASSGDYRGARAAVNSGLLEEGKIARLTDKYLKSIPSDNKLMDFLPDIRSKSAVQPNLAASHLNNMKKPNTFTWESISTPITDNEKKLAKMRGVSDTTVAMTSERGIKFNSQGVRVGDDIKPVSQPTAKVSMENIKDIPKVDKNAQMQTTLLSGINNNTATNVVSNFGLDTLPHSETLLASLIGKGV